MTRSHFQQFYVDPANVYANNLVIEGDEFNHAVRVMRMQPGEEISVTDGLGHVYEGKIVEIQKRSLTVSIEKVLNNAGEPKLQLTLAQAVSKGSGFDWVVEKGTEIGISFFQPIITRRSVAKPDSKIDRWQKKALSAIKQCGRSKTPIVTQPISFKDALLKFKNSVIVIAHESGSGVTDKEIVNALQNNSNAVLFIGPEGGFSRDEFELALENNALPVNLGPRRLRSETAALTAAVKLLGLSNDL